MLRAKRFCSTQRCPRLAVTRGRCAECNTKHDAARPTATQRGYDAQWARFSKQWLATHRWCGERADFRLHAEHSQCVQQGRRTRADVTDHRTALKFGGAKYDLDNLQSLCGNCNRRKGIALEGGFVTV